MLVLSRKRGQSIQIGEQICLQVIGLSGSRVRIGIEAPRDHHIRRGELAAWTETCLDVPPSRRRKPGSQDEHVDC